MKKYCFDCRMPSNPNLIMLCDISPSPNVERKKSNSIVLVLGNNVMTTP
jgi:hypothetical protein